MKNRPLFQFLIFILALILISYLGRNIPLNPEAIQRSLKGIPLIYSSAIFILLYVVITFFIFFSKDLFWLLGAVLFGPFFSAIFICIAEYINAFILFGLSRFLGRAYIQKSLSKKYERWDEKLGSINFFWLLIFRAAPLIPYRFLDLAAGLTKIHFSTVEIFGGVIHVLYIHKHCYALLFMFG